MKTTQLGVKIWVAGLALAVGAVGCGGTDGDSAQGQGDDPQLEVTESALYSTIPIDNCSILVGSGFTFKYLQGPYHYIYTTGSNTAAISCPIPLPNAVSAAMLTQMVYIDSNVGAIRCHLHAKNNNLSSRVMVSEGNTNRIAFKKDGFKYYLYQTVGAMPLSFAGGEPLELLCTLGPGAVLSQFKIAY